MMQRHLDYFSHFSAVGFPISSQVEFERLLKMAFETGQSVPLPGGNGKYVVWEPGEGVQLWVKVKDRVVLGCAPHFRGEGALKVDVQGFYPRPENIAVTDGTLLGMALPTDAASRAFPLVADMPGFEETASRVAPPQTITVQITAFAREMHCFPSAADDEEPSFLFPALVSSPASSAGGLVPAEAQITTRVLKAQRRTNPVTNQSFIVLVVAAPGGGTIDAVASPQSASGQLQEGGCIQGTFWISGRVLTPTPSSDTPERTSASVSPILSRLTNWVRGGS